MAKITIEIEEDEFGSVAMLQRLAPGEPFFIIRGQDKLAARTLRFWANIAEEIGVGNTKVANARKCAHALLQWRPQKMPD